VGKQLSALHSGKGLSHGDLHFGNIFYDEESSQVTLIDNETVKHDSAVYDRFQMALKPLKMHAEAGDTLFKAMRKERLKSAAQLITFFSDSPGTRSSVRKRLQPVLALMDGYVQNLSLPEEKVVVLREFKEACEGAKAEIENQIKKYFRQDREDAASRVVTQRFPELMKCIRGFIDDPGRLE
jgi:hypothetical protein